MIRLYASLMTRPDQPVFDGVVEERGAWTPRDGYQNRVIWTCTHAHPEQGEALACARERIRAMSQEAAMRAAARFQVNELVILDGRELMKVIAVHPSAKDESKPSYTLRPPEHHRWEKYAGEHRLQPASEVTHQPALFDLEG